MQPIPKTERYLIKVDPCTNHDKFFQMIPQGKTFIAVFNNVGLKGKESEYPIEKWGPLYISKISQGYIDRSDLRQNALELDPNRSQKKGIKHYKEIVEKSVKEIVEKLQKLARQNVEENYQTAYELVTIEMIDEAQKIIDMLGNHKSLWQFNDLLIKLFSVIPRRMENVIEHCASTEKDFGKIIANEQDTLDNMKGQVVQLQKTKKVKSDKNQTILEELGLNFMELSKEEEETVKKHLDSETKGRFTRAWKVENKETERKFDYYCKKNKISKIKHYYHGSRSENWWNIINVGLILRPTNAIITGKMFGYGLYFAPKARKSAGYTSSSGSYWANGNDNRGYMAVYKIAYGKSHDVYNHEDSISTMTEERLKRERPGANCVHAHAGSMLYNDEVIVYNENACTIEYLIEFE